MRIPDTRYDRFDALKTLQVEILQCLAKANAPLTKIEICNRLGRVPASTPVGGLTRLLATQGCVKAKRASDGRTLLYSLTDEGKELAKHPERVGSQHKGTLLPVEW